MTMQTSAQFDAKNELEYKTPIYLVDFIVDEELDIHERFCTYLPKNVSTPTPLPYVSFISGGSYSVTPDEGTTSSASVTITLQDTDGYITEMLATAQGNLQNKRCNIYMGYYGMDESEMLPIFAGLVTNYSYEDDGSWQINTSDAIRAMNKYIFREASEAEPTEIRGNPINLMLALLLSDKGDGSNTYYDYLAPGIGLGIDQSLIDIERFEDIRDTYYPTTVALFKFSIKARSQANDFFKQEFFKPLNMYPIIRGDGQYSASIYRPPLPPYGDIHIDEDTMVGIPKYSGNLSSMINEVQFSYDYGDGASDAFNQVAVYVDAISINNRGVGDRTLEINSQGIHSSEMDTSSFNERSSNRILNRYAIPPILVVCKLEFKNLTVEAGDILFVSNKFLPNLSTGNFDLENIPMEVVKRSVDWKRGSVTLSLLQTGYNNKQYAAISPRMNITSGISSTQFVVDDVSNWLIGYKGSLMLYKERSVIYSNQYAKLIVDDVEITNIDTVTNTITVTDMGITPQTGWRFSFNDNGTNLTDDQIQWGRIGAGYVITP